MNLHRISILLSFLVLALLAPDRAWGEVHKPVSSNAPKWIAAKQTRISEGPQGEKIAKTRVFGAMSRQLSEPTVVVPRGITAQALRDPHLIERVSEARAKPRITVELQPDGTGHLLHSDGGIVRRIDVVVKGDPDKHAAHNLASVAYNHWSGGPYSLEVDAATYAVRIRYADGTRADLADANIPFLAPPVDTRRHATRSQRDVAER